MLLRLAELMENKMISAALVIFGFLATLYFVPLLFIPFGIGFPYAFLSVGGFLGLAGAWLRILVFT